MTQLLDLLPVDFKAVVEQTNELSNFLKYVGLIKQGSRLQSSRSGQLRELRAKNIEFMIRLFPLIDKKNIVSQLQKLNFNYDLQFTKNYKNKDVKKFIADGETKKVRMVKDPPIFDSTLKIPKSQIVLKRSSLNFLNQWAENIHDHTDQSYKIIFKQQEGTVKKDLPDTQVPDDEQENLISTRKIMTK